MRELWPADPWPALHEALPNRTDRAILYRAQTLSIRRDRSVNDPDPSLDPIVAALRDARQAKHWKQYALAAEMAVQQQQLSHWERGGTVPNLENAHAWAKALGYRIELVPVNAPQRARPAVAEPVASFGAPDRARLMAGR